MNYQCLFRFDKKQFELIADTLPELIFKLKNFLSELPKKRLCYFVIKSPSFSVHNCIKSLEEE